MTFRFLPLVVAVAVAFLAPAYGETTADRWDLSEIYPSVAAWNADAGKVDAQLKELAGCKGHLGDSAARFKRCLDLQADLTKRYYRLAAYAGEQAAEDTGNAAYLELDQKARPSRQPGLPKATAFVDPELLHIGKKRIDAISRQRPVAVDLPLPARRKPCAMAPHTLSDEGEALIAKFGLMDNAGRIGLHASHQRRHAVAEGQALHRRGGHARRVGVHQVPRAAEPRRPQESHGRVFRHVQDLRAHDRRRPVFAAQAEHRLREGAQVPGFDHRSRSTATTFRSRSSTS